ncbi:hypothetical protein RRF57_010661 [Xylaria bambusicola]|uniref:Uncharacterized protein n=1 Tax=Xylaria bambusicola TaxID=326684 RepID=A0AAN7V1P4_9PEZI
MTADDFMRPRRAGEDSFRVEASELGNDNKQQQLHDLPQNSDVGPLSTQLPKIHSLGVSSLREYGATSATGLRKWCRACLT